MKKLKKVLAFLLTAILIVSLCSLTAFAEGEQTKNNSITVTGAVEGETYKIFKMLDLTVDDEFSPSAYTYKVNAAWTDFFTTGAGKDYVTIDASDGHVTWVAGKDSEAEMVKFAQAAEAAAASASALDTIEATGETVVFSNLEDGYYLVTSTLGTKAMIDTTPDKTAVTIEEKNPEDTIEKQVKEDSSGVWGETNDAQVGDTVEFKSTATIQPYTRNVFIHDTMDAGLDYQNDVAIAGLNAGEDYVVLETPHSGDTYTIQIKDTYIAGLTEAATLTLTYTAKLNEKAVQTTTTPGDGEGAAETSTTSIVDQKNTTKITYGDKQSVEDKTTTTTHKFSVYKHAKDKTDNLAGAEFKLQIPVAEGASEGTKPTELKLIKIDDNNYRVAKPDEAGAVETFTTVESGDIVIWGVDSDTYQLVEVNAPSGYNKLSAPVDVKVDADNSTRVDVVNNSGTELPSTGGIGTTIFYVVGGLLLVGAGVLLVTKKRAGSDS